MADHRIDCQYITTPVARGNYAAPAPRVNRNRKETGQ
jgi:hypothetical protein